MTQLQTEHAILRNIADYYDPDQIVDILGLSSEELVELLRPLIEQSFTLFEDVYGGDDNLEEEEV